MVLAGWGVAWLVLEWPPVVAGLAGMAIARLLRPIRSLFRSKHP